MTRWLVVALLALAPACDDSGGGAVDAGLDAQRRLAITVEGPAELGGTRSVKVTITASGQTRTDTVPVGGLPATVDLPAPIQLTDWAIVVDAFDMNSQRIGRGTTTVPSGTSTTTVTLAAVP